MVMHQRTNKRVDRERSDRVSVTDPDNFLNHPNIMYSIASLVGHSDQYPDFLSLGLSFYFYLLLLLWKM